MCIVTICHNDIFRSCIHHQFIHSHSPSFYILLSFLVDLLHICFFTSNNCTPANLSHQRITQHFRSIDPNYTPHHNPPFHTKKTSHIFSVEQTPFKLIYTLLQKHRTKTVDASEILHELPTGRFGKNRQNNGDFNYQHTSTGDVWTGFLNQPSTPIGDRRMGSIRTVGDTC